MEKIGQMDDYLKISMLMCNSVAPTGLNSESVFYRQGFHYIPPPAYSSAVPTGLCSTWESRRDDRPIGRWCKPLPIKKMKKYDKLICLYGKFALLLRRQTFKFNAL